MRVRTLTVTTRRPNTAAYTEATLSLAQVNAASVPLALLLLLVCGLPYLVLWGPASLLAGLGALGLWIIPVIIAGVVVHELLHGLGWKWFGGLAWRDIQFGFHWQGLVPYAHARVPMPARAYRWGGALPGLVTGGLPVAVGLAFGQPVVLLLGAFFLLAALGDAMVLWAIRRVPATARVLDHPSLPGCLVLKES
jgi:hypothetical protein